MLLYANNDVYFGITMNEEHTRMAGHCSNFIVDDHAKSALSMHVYSDHPELVGPSEGYNYNVIILKQSNAINLRHNELYYIWSMGRS